MEVDEATFSSGVERIAALLETKNLVILKKFVGSMKLSRKSGLQYWQMSKFAEFLEQPCVILLKNLDNGGEGLADAITDLAAPDRALQMHIECRILGTISSDDIQENLRVLWQDCTVKMESLQRALMASMLKVTTAESGFDNIRPKLLETFTTASELIQTDKPDVEFQRPDPGCSSTRRGSSTVYQPIVVPCSPNGWAAHLADTE